MSIPPLRLLGCSLAAVLLSACGGDVADTGNDVENFEIAAGGTGTLIEGATEELVIPIQLTRGRGHDAPVELTFTGEGDSDMKNLTAGFDEATLSGDRRNTRLRLRLNVAAAPIQAGDRRLYVTADDGTDAERIALDIAVQPTDAPDVYLLVGQSNMVGFSGEATRQGEPGGPDAPDPRIRQLNVSANDSFVTFSQPVHFKSTARNVGDPLLTLAEDPLHVPRSSDDIDGGKSDQYIGLGLSFAKRALASTTADIVLVPAAWSGSSFCDNSNGPRGNWAVGATDPALGNSLLFDRAVLRADLALQASGGVLRGILWHQGESDANEVCAPLYADNLDRMAHQFRQRIRPDARGAVARGADANVPFVVGTLSRGSDARGDLSTFGPSKQTVDEATRLTPQRLAHSAVSVHDDLIPANGYPCGNTTCVHFGAEALREIGQRYHVALERALTNAPQR